MNDRSSRRRDVKALIGSLGLFIGGMLPLVLGVVGIVHYVERGYVEARGGGIYDTGLGLAIYAVWILGGLGLVAFGIWNLRRHARHTESESNP